MIFCFCADLPASAKLRDKIEEFSHMYIYMTIFIFSNSFFILIKTLQHFQEVHQMHIINYSIISVCGNPYRKYF